jgi:hypothetical protein
MSVPCIRYRSGYKYQLRADHIDAVSVRPDNDIVTEYIELTAEGTLTLKSGYAWDGPSGPSPDLPSLMRGSLVHDALYQLMRGEVLDKDEWREEADRELRRMSRDVGLWAPLDWMVYTAVRRFGDPSASPDHERRVRTAPRRCVMSSG